MNKSCESCYYNDVCRMADICEDYYPIDEDAEEEVLYEMIEQEREAFRKEWFEYISENE